MSDDHSRPSAITPADGKFVLYLVGFVAAWTGYVLAGYTRLQALDPNTLAYAAANIAIRLALWVAPVFFYLKLVDRVDPLPSLKLTDEWKRGVFFGIGLSVLVLAGSIARFGKPEIAGNAVTWNSILGTSFGVGFFEEIPFRGFILQKLSTRMNFWLANLLSSLLFVGLHLPGWLMLHLFTPAAALNVFIFSIVMGAMLRYSRSLWGCIIGHNANDFISFILFHGRAG